MVKVRKHELKRVRHEHPKEGRCEKCAAIMERHDRRLFPERINEFEGPDSPAREMASSTVYICECCGIWLDVLAQDVSFALEG